MATRYPLVISGTQIQELQTGDTLLGSVANITGGSAGQLPYQSAANTTGFTAAGTSGQYLQSTGAGAPTWATINALPAQTSNSGKYLTTDGTTASWGTVLAGGKVLQMVHSTPNNATTNSNSLTAFASLGITPTSNTSRILFTFSCFFGSSGGRFDGGAIALYNATQGTALVPVGGTDSAGYFQIYVPTAGTSGLVMPYSHTVVDSPASTSSQNYQVQFATRGSVNLNILSGKLVLMEIAP